MTTMKWRSHAEELRMIAETIRDQDTRNSLLKIAADWDQMAEKQEVRDHARRPAKSRSSR